MDYGHPRTPEFIGVRCRSLVFTAAFCLGAQAKIFMITEKNTGVRKIPKKVTPIIPAKTAVPNA
jgi:hypothetical protein